MKKTILIIGTILMILGISDGVLTALSNELAFKFYNQQGISSFQKKEWTNSRENFEQVALKFRPWQLVGKNNELAVLCEQKKYSVLDKQLENILQNECSLSAEKIPSFCENIFYLAGLTQYRLGEELETKNQKPFFERAIFEFQKTLALNPQNTWAKENIDFIFKIFAEKQRQEQQKQEQKSGGKNQSGKDDDKQDKQNSNQNKNSNKQNEQQNSAKNLPNKDEQSGQDEKNAENSVEGSEKNPAKNQPTLSRLPENIKQAIEQAQQDLEQDKNQQGFYRSRSAAEKDKQKSNNPFNMFENDPFFQNFFGNDPFFNSHKKLTKTIADPDEKDW